MQVALVMDTQRGAITKLGRGLGEAYIGPMTWEISSDDWDVARDFPNTRQFASPCGVLVLVRGLSIELTLLLMHHKRMFASVRVAITEKEFSFADVCCQADFLAWYGRLDLLAELLETSAPACNYVLKHFSPGKVAALSCADDDRYVPVADVADAIEMARVCTAARAAREALASIDS